MMNKLALCAISLLGFCLGTLAQTPSPLVREIGLIDSEDYRSVLPPDRLIVGLELSRKAYYKIIQRGQTLKGGLFLEGFNSFSLETDNYFDRSGAHPYTLELKTENRLVKKVFEIAVEMEDRAPPSKKEPPVEKKEYTVLMYIGDQLVASSKKLPTAEPPKQIEIPPPPYQIDPYASAAEPSQTVTGVPVLAAAMAIFQTIKDLAAKKDQSVRVQSIQKKSVILSTFLRSSGDGKAYLAKATISLHIRK